VVTGLLFELTPAVIASTIAFFFAGYVLYHGPRERRHQALALVLFFIALQFLNVAISVVTYDGFQGWRFGEVYTDLVLAVPIFFILFAVVTHAPALARRWWLHPTLWLLPVLAFAGLRILDRSKLDGVLEGGAPGYGGGPLSVVSWILGLALSIVPLLFIRRALRATQPAERDANLVLACGLAAWHLYNGSRNFVFILYYGMTAPTTIGAGVAFACYLATVLLSLAAPVVLGYVALRQHPAPLIVVRAAVFLLITSVFGAIDQVIFILHYDAGIAIPYQLSIRFATWASWMLLSVIVLAYGILKGDVINLQRRARRTIRASTIAGAFIGVFFAASELTQQFFQARGQFWAGVVAAAVLALAIRPLQRLADRLATTALPPMTKESMASREAAYRSAIRIALRDRRLTAREELELLQLAEELGLPATRALELRNEGRTKNPRSSKEKLADVAGS
jgi:hypothetical protein